MISFFHYYVPTYLTFFLISSGRWFALQEIKTIVSLILRNYTIEASSPVEFPTNALTRIPSGKVIFKRREY